MSFIEAKIVSQNVNPVEYRSNAGERGQGTFCMSPSALKEFSRCPARWVAGYQSPESTAMRWGSLVDALLLTPDDFQSRYLVLPKTYPVTMMECPKCHSQTDSKSCRACGCQREPKTVEKDWNAGAEYCREYMALHAGREAISADLEAEALKAIAVLQEDEILSSYIEASDRQVWVSGLWRDEPTKVIVPVRCLIDLAPRADTEWQNTLGDLKTDTCAAVLPFNRKAHKYGYHVQAAFDLDLFNAATGEQRHDWCLVVQENFPPYQIGRRFMSGGDMESGFIALGRAAYQKAMHNYCACLASGKWPAYDDTDESTQGWTPMHPEPWMENEEMFAPKYEFATSDHSEAVDEPEPAYLN